MLQKIDVYQSSYIDLLFLMGYGIIGTVSGAHVGKYSIHGTCKEMKKQSHDDS